MAAIISNSSPLSATYVAGGITEVIASGDFENSVVQIYAAANGQDGAPVYTFFGPGAVSVQAAPSTVITASVVGSGPSAIDVTCNP